MAKPITDSSSSATCDRQAPRQFDSRDRRKLLSFLFDKEVFLRDHEGSSCFLRKSLIGIASLEVIGISGGVLNAPASSLSAKAANAVVVK